VVITVSILVQTDDKQGACLGSSVALGSTRTAWSCSREGPDAVLVTIYLMTVGFMRAADEMGTHCPEDFALVSFDDYS
jgi:DNA-binding LacI/PurR family transcriptional regulator